MMNSSQETITMIIFTFVFKKVVDFYQPYGLAEAEIRRTAEEDQIPCFLSIPN